MSPRALGLLLPFTAACISEGIRRDTGIVSWLSWPDVVTIGSMAVAKASLLLASRPDGQTRVAMGILVDCFSRCPSAFPVDMPTTSILESLGVEIDIDLLRDKILHALNWYYAEWERGMHLRLVKRIQSTIAWFGRDVEVKTSSGQIIRGIAKGLDEFGSLELEQRDRVGRRRTRALSPLSVEVVNAVK